MNSHTSLTVIEHEHASGSGKPGWLARLGERLRIRRAGGWHRQAVAGVLPKGAINLSTNDYLGLAQHPRVIEGAVRAVRESGAGSRASRLAGGSLELHERLEARLALFKGAQGARLFPTGYMANLGVFSALVGADDLALGDKLNHASLLDGAGLAAGRARVYRHGDIARAEELARRHLEERPEATVWLVSDSVFSMDGDVAAIAELGAMRDRLGREFPEGGVCLILDEAHATGVLGPGGAGLDAAAGHVADITISTASKALGSLGGFVCGRVEVIEALDNFSRPFIFTTAAAPAQVGAIDAALDMIRDEPERRARLGDVIVQVRTGLREAGWRVASADEALTPIVPLVVGEAEDAVELSRKMAEARIWAPAIRPPTVERGGSRVRISLHSELSERDIEKILDCLDRARREFGGGSAPSD